MHNVQILFYFLTNTLIIFLFLMKLYHCAGHKYGTIILIRMKSMLKCCEKNSQEKLNLKLDKTLKLLIVDFTL